MSDLATSRSAGRRVAFEVLGLPVAQGSKSAFVVKGRAVLVEKARAALGPWRQAIAAAVAVELDEPLVGPVAASLVFVLPRPKAHYRGRDELAALREDAPRYVSTRPDVDKLARAVLDALTGVAFRDDGQVAELRVVKHFGERVGLEVELRSLA